MKLKMIILATMVFSAAQTFANELCFKSSNQNPITVSLRHDENLRSEYAVTVRNGATEYTAWYKPTILSDSQLELTKTIDLSNNETYLPQNLTLSLVIQGFNTYKVLAGERIFDNNSVIFGNKDCGPEAPPQRRPIPGGPNGGCPNSPKNHCI